MNEDFKSIISREDLLQAGCQYAQRPVIESAYWLKQARHRLQKTGQPSALLERVSTMIDDLTRLANELADPAPEE